MHYRGMFNTNCALSVLSALPSQYAVFSHRHPMIDGPVGTENIGALPGTLVSETALAAGASPPNMGECYTTIPLTPDVLYHPTRSEVCETRGPVPCGPAHFV